MFNEEGNMFDSQILDTAVGLVFIYFFLSILCSAIIEIVSSLTKKRSRMLGIGIEKLLRDSMALEKLYLQPFFMGKTAPGNLFQSLWDSIVPLPSRKNRVPSYISSRSFVLSLLESLKQHPDVITNLLMDKIASPGKEREMEAFKQKVTELPAESSNKNELISLLSNAGGDMQDVGKKFKEFYGKTSGHFDELILKEIIPSTENYIQDVKTMLKALPDSNQLKKVLLPLLNIAGNNMDQAFQSIEKWYDEGMERVTGWYKKYSQTFGMILAVVVALLLNADSFEMGRAIYRDKVLSATLVDLASQRVHSMNPPASDTTGNGGNGKSNTNDPGKEPHGAVAATTSADAGKQLRQTGVVSGKTGQTAESGEEAGSENNVLRKNVEQLNEDFKQISSINLPVGWPVKIDSEKDIIIQLKQFFDQIKEKKLLTPEKLFGILVTALMVSMGSSFWFELLSKLLNIRSAGKKPLSGEEQESRKASSP